MTTMQEPRYASPVDYEAYGEYGPGRGSERGKSFQRPRYRFQGRISADGSSGYRAETGRFLFGDRITEADVRLWPTLARFDLSYNPLGKISERRLTSYPNLWGYLRHFGR